MATLTDKHKHRIVHQGYLIACDHIINRGHKGQLTTTDVRWCPVYPCFDPGEIISTNKMNLSPEDEMFGWTSYGMPPYFVVIEMIRNDTKVVAREFGNPDGRLHILSSRNMKALSKKETAQLIADRLAGKHGELSLGQYVRYEAPLRISVQGVSVQGVVVTGP